MTDPRSSSGTAGPGCIQCGSPDLEDWGDGERDIRCYRCNDRLIEQSNRVREWNYYHPGMPIPESER